MHPFFDLDFYVRKKAVHLLYSLSKTPIMKTKAMTRFDTRLSKEQKEYLEYASRLGGYKTLSDFILSSAKQQADQIVERHQQILATTHDREVFFSALLRPQKPNASLKAAAARYQNKVKEQ